MVVRAGLWDFIGLIIVPRAYRFTRLNRLINRRQASTIGSPETGFAVIEGNVVALDDLLEAPLTGEPCVAFGVMVAVPGEDADIAGSSRSIPFKLDDGTGSIEGDPAGFVWTGIYTLQHEDGDTPSHELLERVRLLYPYIENRSAGGDLAMSRMTCREKIIREGTSLCMACHVVVTHDKTQFGTGNGKPKVIAAPTPGALLEEVHGTVRSYWVAAAVFAATGVIGHLLHVFGPPFPEELLPLAVTVGLLPLMFRCGELYTLR